VRRNALVVLGNTAQPGDVAARDAIARSIADADPVIRAHAVWAAARIGHLDLVPVDDPDEAVKAELRVLPPRRG
jgi:hypothetical protein